MVTRSVFSYLIPFLFLAILPILMSSGSRLPVEPCNPHWGFFAHRRINRLAVLTLPPEMMVFFKRNIDWVADHAVDPDMRRYATKQEGPRHFIDLDRYGKAPYDNLPRTWPEAMAKFAEIYGVTAKGDSILLFGADHPVPETLHRAYRDLNANYILPQLYRDASELHPDTLRRYLGEAIPPDLQAAYFLDPLSEHGVLPWNLQRMQRQMTQAFRRRDARTILKYCAEMGHYIGDAHVPLHTTSNYNGQKSNQHGIHGFWESRIPELFADDTYDYIVGKPEQIKNIPEYYWKVVMTSNSMVDSVLHIEKLLRGTFPQDRQMCPDVRLGITVIVPCRDFAAAYQTAMRGMVERRMRAAVHAVSSAWYTAWIDAGQPDLRQMNVEPLTEAEKKEQEEMRKRFDTGKIIGRPEEN
jgi:hypothetical protein